MNRSTLDFFTARFWGLMVLYVFVLGCNTVNTVAPSEPFANKQMISDKRVLPDPILGSRAQILGVNETVTPGGFAKVQVEIRNATSRPKHFEYLFEWFDIDGNLVQSSSKVYQVREILGKETIFLTSIAPTQNAKDFRLKLTRAKR